MGLAAGHSRPRTLARDMRCVNPTATHSVTHSHTASVGGCWVGAPIVCKRHNGVVSSALWIRADERARKREGNDSQQRLDGPFLFYSPSSAGLKHFSCPSSRRTTTPATPAAASAKLLPSGTALGSSASLSPTPLAAWPAQALASSRLRSITRRLAKCLWARPGPRPSPSLPSSAVLSRMPRARLWF